MRSSYGRQFDKDVYNQVLRIKGELDTVIECGGYSDDHSLILASNELDEFLNDMDTLNKKNP